MASFLLGLGLGALVAAQVGPLSLLLIRSVLRGSVPVGLAIGAAVALVDLCYAALGVAGAAPLLEVGPLRLFLGLAGGAVLAYLGFRTLHSAFRVRLGGETLVEVSTPRRAFVTALGATASNPLTILSWAALFAAASTTGAAQTGPQAVALLVGVGVGSGLWHLLLTGAVAMARRYVTDRLLVVVDVIAGMGLVGFGGVLAARAIRG
jgi:putative LysE/RhtB family amino acid efflux pump